MEGPTDLRLTFLSCIFDGLFGDTPLDHIFSHMPICPYAPNMPIRPEVNVSELHFWCFFRGYPIWPYFFRICPYAHMPIWPNMGIWAYGHMGICKKNLTSGVSLKRASKMQHRDVDLRSLGHSSQKLWLKIDFWIFWAHFPISTDQIKNLWRDRSNMKSKI